MKLLLSGEGPTDIGVNRPVDGGTSFVPGPMAELIDQLLKSALGYSLLELQDTTDAVSCLSRGELSLRKQAREGRPSLLPGLKTPRGMVGPQAQAWGVGALAAKRAQADQVPVVAVVFHDSDGTRSAPRTQWKEMVDAIDRGFALANFNDGVAMVPRPKSEAWMLCALRSPAYQRCEALEDAPGNDGSPNALKNRLADLNGGVEPSGELQAQWVRDGRVDATQISMPSFEAFKARLDKVLCQVTRRNWQPGGKAA